MFDAIRRALFQKRRPSQVTSTPDTDVAEQLPLQPALDILPPAPPLVSRPRLAIPPIIEKGASIPPQVGERAYYNNASAGCMAWEINGNKSLCHFSAPSSVYPGPGAIFIGVVDKVDGVCHHVLPPSGFSVKDTR